jgi:hypothetical protein
MIQVHKETLKIKKKILFHYNVKVYAKSLIFNSLKMIKLIQINNLKLK